MTFLLSPGFEHLIRALLHSLWQAPLLAVLLYGVLCLLPARAANLRYVLSLAMLVGTLFAVLLTWSYLNHPLTSPPDRVANVTSAAVPGGTAGAAAPAVPVIAPAAWRAMPWAGIVGLVYLAGLVLMLIRTARSFSSASRLPALGTPLSDPRLLDLIASLASRLHLRHPLRTFVSPAYTVPAVMGTLAPILLLPASLVTELPPEHLRLILAHELAHIRRHDYFLNLLQAILEALLFFNPAIWYLSHLIRQEREACCDRIAAEVAGSPVEAAQTLADVAARITSWPRGQMPVAAAALAYTGPSGPGGRTKGRALLDRVTRLLRPDARPVLRFPLRTFTGALLISMCLLLILQTTATLTVQAAEALLTPQQRIDKMAELQRDIDPPPNVLEEKAEKLTIQGTLRTADDEPLPTKQKDFRFTAMSRYRGGLAAYSLGPNAQGHFRQQVTFGSVMIVAEVPGYAPLIVGPVEPKKGADPQQPATLPPFDLVLTEGFTGRIQLTDPQGHPIPKAAATLAYQREDPENFCVDQSLTTDGAGFLSVDNALDRPAQLTVEIPGFQYDRLPLKLSATQPVVLKLAPAAPTVMTVVDAKGQAVAGASVALLRRQGFHDQTWYPHPTYPAPILGRTDPAGHCTFTTFRDDCHYALRISAPDCASQIVQEVRAGMKDLAVTLAPENPIQLHILADPGAKIPATVQVSNTLILAGNTGYEYDYAISVQAQDGAGHATLRDSLPSRVTFSVGEKSVRVNPADFTNPVVLDLRTKPAPAQATRTVIFRFDLPPGAPPPQGRMRLDYIRPGHPGSYFPEELAIQNGEARFDVPVPTTIGYQQGSLIGYTIGSKHEIELPAGTEPFLVTIPAYPAGAAFGRILDADGTVHNTYFYAKLLVAKPAPSLPAEQAQNAVDGYNSNDATGKFLLRPIPLGGTYRICATSSGSGASLVLSDEFTVDAAHPIREMDLRFPAGIAVHGTVLLPDGSPAANRQAALEYDIIANGCSYGFTVNMQTDHAGQYRVEHVNAGLPGTYALTLRPGLKTQGLSVLQFKPSEKPFDLQLQAGYLASGTVVDDATGKPLPNLQVRCVPPYPGAKCLDSIETTTDAKGAFPFDNLEALTYTVYVNDAYPPGTTFTRGANGSLTIRYGGVQPTITADTVGRPVEIRVVLPPP